jgi:hypothetical protein
VVPEILSKIVTFCNQKGGERIRAKGGAGIAPAAKSDRMREQAGGETA